jgi:hypothetical protein
VNRTISMEGRYATRANVKRRRPRGRVGLSALGVTHQGHPVRLVDPVLHCLVDELGVGW